MASELASEVCCMKDCWGACEQNSIVNGVHADDWTAELAIIVNNAASDMSLSKIIFTEFNSVTNINWN